MNTSGPSARGTSDQYLQPIQSRASIRCLGCASPKLHLAEKLNDSLEILTVKSWKDRPTLANCKAMKIQADGILAKHRTKNAVPNRKTRPQLADVPDLSARRESNLTARKEVVTSERRRSPRPLSLKFHGAPRTSPLLLCITIAVCQRGRQGFLLIGIERRRTFRILGSTESGFPRSRGESLLECRDSHLPGERRYTVRR
jgi:hypothetical protein